MTVISSLLTLARRRRAMRKRSAIEQYKIGKRVGSIDGESPSVDLNGLTVKLSVVFTDHRIGIDLNHRLGRCLFRTGDAGLQAIRQIVLIQNVDDGIAYPCQVADGVVEKCRRLIPDFTSCRWTDFTDKSIECIVIKSNRLSIAIGSRN